MLIRSLQQSIEFRTNAVVNSEMKSFMTKLSMFLDPLGIKSLFRRKSKLASVVQMETLCCGIDCISRLMAGLVPP